MKPSLILLFLLSVLSLSPAAPRGPGSIAFDEKSSYLEADILPDKGQVQNRMAVRDNHRLWPGGKLLYKLDFDTQANTYVKDTILSAVDQINRAGCVTLTAASHAQDYVSIRLGDDYSSHVGRQGGPQNLTVVARTIDRGSTMHELMHALGFAHEHNRPDRDNYVMVNFDNIQESAKPYFAIYSVDDPLIEEQHLSYDYTSLMHATDMYDEEVNVDVTQPVIWRKDGGVELGQRTFLTEVDKQRLRMVYSCDVCKSVDANNLLFRYPGDCSKYIQCSNTFVYVMDCPAGLHFSREVNRCEYPHQANCTSLLDS